MFMHPAFLAGLGILVGFLMGLTSFTGAVIVPALVLGYGMAQKKAQGTAVALTLSPLQIPALLHYVRNKNVDWFMMRWMVPGVVAGTFLGSMVANALPPVVLKTFFGLMMVYVGAYLLMGLTTANTAKAVALAVVVAACAGATMAVSRWAEPQAEATTVEPQVTTAS